MYRPNRDPLAQLEIVGGFSAYWSTQALGGYILDDRGLLYLSKDTAVHLETVNVFTGLINMHTFQDFISGLKLSDIVLLSST